MLSESEIERVPTVFPGESAEASAEAMNEPGNPGQRIGRENDKFRFLGNFDGHQNILATRSILMLAAVAGGGARATLIGAGYNSSLSVPRDARLS